MWLVRLLVLYLLRPVALSVSQLTSAFMKLPTGNMESMSKKPYPCLKSLLVTNDKAQWSCLYKQNQLPFQTMNYGDFESPLIVSNIKICET